MESVTSLQMASAPFPSTLKKGFNSKNQYQPPRYITNFWLPAELSVAQDTFLGSVIYPDFNPPPCYLPNLYLNYLPGDMLCERVSKTLLQSGKQHPLLSCHPPRRSGYQLGQARCALWKLTLTAPDKLYILHVSEKGFQDYLLHHIHRDAGEAEQLVVL